MQPRLRRQLLLPRARYQVSKFLRSYMLVRAAAQLACETSPELRMICKAAAVVVERSYRATHVQEQLCSSRRQSQQITSRAFSAFYINIHFPSGIFCYCILLLRVRCTYRMTEEHGEVERLPRSVWSYDNFKQ